MANENELVPILNPLFVYVVVHELFEHLPLKDIISLRRVCKLWQQIGLTRLKKDVDLIRISFDPQKSIETFLEMAKGFSFKFTNFAIKYLDDASNYYAIFQIYRLFDEYGTHMKEISLNLCDSPDSWTFLSDVLVNKAPNIERLRLERYLRNSNATELFSWKKKPTLKLKRLKLVWQNESIEPINYHALLADLFSCSPYLDTFVAPIFDDMSLNNYVFQLFTDKGNICSLKKLHLFVSEDYIIEVLATSFKYAPLENVNLQIRQMDLSTLAYYETFLSDHRDTLTNLYIVFPCVEFVEQLPFPTMNNLKVLDIATWWWDEESELHDHRIPFGTFNFGKLFPNLITLYMTDLSASQGISFINLDEVFPEEITPVLTLKNLALPPFSNPNMLRRIGRIFPNVLKLEVIPQTPDVLRELWTTWPEIKTLNIWILPHESYRSTNLDSVFTGVDGSDHSRNFPSISHLRILKHLEIHQGYECPYLSASANVEDIQIKDGTALLALAEMKELVTLRISGDRHQISSPCVQYLCAELDMMKAETEVEDRTLYLVKYEWQRLSYWPMANDYK